MNCFVCAAHFVYVFFAQVFVSKSEEEVESRTKLVDGLKTALRTQPLRYCNYQPCKLCGMHFKLLQISPHGKVDASSSSKYVDPTYPQWSNAAHVRNMSRFKGGKLPGNSKHFFKKSKDKSSSWKEKLYTLSICGKVPVCLPLTLWPRTLFCHCISGKAFSRTLLCKHFELIRVFKALTIGCAFVSVSCKHE